MRFDSIFKDTAKIKLTRIADVELADGIVNDLYARARLANQCKADVFVSIHCNSSPDPTAHGVEVWTCCGDTGADKLAERIVESFRRNLPELYVRTDMTDGDSDKEANFIVLIATAMPAVLVELPFISNPKEEMMLKDGRFQLKLARAVAEGVAEFLGITLPEEWDPEKEIAKLKEAGIITNEHRPRDAVTWGELATVLNRILEGRA